MPELPEVQCVINSIKNKIINKKIKDIKIFSNRLREPLDENLKKLINKTVIDIYRRGKYIIFILDANSNSKSFLIVHLGMTGALLFRDKKNQKEKHDHVLIEFENFNLVYNDIRKFGIFLFEKDLNQNKYIKKLGKEPLDENFVDSHYIFQESRFSKKNIKSFLLDQTKIAGIGNIYAVEALFLSKINPERIANSLSYNESQELSSNIQKLLLKSIKMGGSSISDYKNANNEKGSFQNTFNVYGKKECNNCQSKIIKINQNGRSTYFCPHCQK